MTLIKLRWKINCPYQHRWKKWRKNSEKNSL